MKKTTRKVGARYEYGRVSLKMFQIPHSKALIIAYLDLRSGLKKYTFNQTDISNQSDIGKTVVRQYMKELENEGVLNRKGKGQSFYKLNRQRMEELYYTVSESDLIELDSDACLSENDTEVSESDSDVSESDAIHSSSLHSIKLDSKKLDPSKLHTNEIVAVATSCHDWRQSEAEEQSDATLPRSLVDRFDKFILPEKAPTVSGTPPVPLEKLSGTSCKSLDSGTGPEPLGKVALGISGQTARETTPATDTERRPPDSTPVNGQNIHSASLTVPDELTKRIRTAEACREIEKWKGRKPELVAKYFDDIFGK